MLKYVIKRILWLIPVIMGVSLIVFTLMYFAPGDPASVILGGNATVEDVEALRETMGLNRGYFERLAEFFSNTFIHFDLGSSYITKAAISGEIINRLPFLTEIGLSQ